MAIIANDNFTEVSTTDLVGHTSDSGDEWLGDTRLDVIGGAGTVNTVVGSGARHFAAIDVAPASADYKVSADITINNLNDFKAAGVTLRATGASFDNCYGAQVDNNNEEVQLVEVTSGTETTIGTAFTLDVSSLPVTYKITVQAVGTTIKLFVDDVERDSTTDSTHTATGLAGLFARSASVALDAPDIGVFIAETVGAPAGPTITDVNTTNIVQVDDTPTVTGTAFLATAGSQTWNAVSVGVDTWADTSILCTAITRGDKAYDTNYPWIVTDNLSVASSPLNVQLAIETGFQFIDLVDPINILVGGEITSLCFGTSPPCITGDQLRVPLLTDQGKAIDISAADGTFVITAAGDTEQTFMFELWDQTGPVNERWSLFTAVVINGVIQAGGAIVIPLTQELTQDLTESLT